MEIFLLVLAVAVPAYALGSVNGAITMSKYFYKKDIREFGSGNPGLTNFYRVFGVRGVILVVAIDMFKTVAPVIFGGWLFAHFTDMALSQTWLLNSLFEVAIFGQAVSGFFVMMGHCFPLYYRFKGGKGVMAVGTVLIVLDWRLALISWGLFILITFFSRYVSFGAMVGGAAFPVSMLLIGVGGYWEFAATLVCAILLIARHEPNIRRLIKGEESKFSIKRGRQESGVRGQDGGR
ncbi:MAG: glycerol-3-phosphate 1-O-acyltransferase PlsY [Oscillospiraceae bacterium]|nr:glycerol-3-phosphate 1-O-acyltransferase PlsY [Oscillospiraceae bacterium]